MGATDPNRVRYLAALGLMPQCCLTVEGRAPFGGPVLVAVGSARYALGRETAEQITVVPDVPPRRRHRHGRR
jgi:Fe2+ transport system protein FeoA